MAALKKLELQCTIEMGAFNSERVFRIQLANGEVYQSLAAYLHFWNSADERISRNEPSRGNSIEGLVAARLLKQSKDQLTVEIPDGEVVVVSPEIAVFRHQEVDTNVPVGSGSR